MRITRLGLAVFLLSSTAALAAPPADLDATMARALAEFEVPGAAGVIVEDGKTVLAKGYGVRGQQDQRPVDAQTLFGIGSCSKAFTAALVEALADDGKISLDDRIVDRVPAFRLADSYAAANATVRDALTHHTGLGQSQGDLLWIVAPVSRTEMLSRVRMMTPPHTLRETFAYNNLAYAAAGEAAGNAAGSSYEAALRARIFTPLGIEGAAITEQDYEKAPNKALEHTRISDGFSKGKVEPIQRTRLNAIAPAGSLALSAEQLGKWLMVQLADGALPNGRRLWSEARAKEMRSVVTPMPAAGGLAGAQSQLGGYALGWGVFDAGGHVVVTHTGGTIGATSQVAYIPDLNVGFAVVTSTGELSAMRSVALTLFDHYLKRDKSDRVAELKKQGETAEAKVLEQIQKAQAARDPHAKLPPDADRFVGIWKGGWMGDATVARDGEGLTIKFNDAANFGGKLEPWRGDTFLVRWSERFAGNALVTFERKPSDNMPDRITFAALAGDASLLAGVALKRTK